MIEHLKLSGYVKNSNGKYVKLFSGIKPTVIDKLIIKKTNTPLDFIEINLIDLDIDYIMEYRFSNERKFRFDFYLPNFKTGIEYEGLMSAKSRHTSIKGYSDDCEKYNLAQLIGLKVLRYTALNYQNISLDLKKLMK